jgi:large subunit ribosomal protein L29
MSKPAELREQTSEQLELLLTDVKSNLFRLRLQSETERLEAPSEIVKAKREIARIKTILQERLIEHDKAVPAEVPVAKVPVATPAVGKPPVGKPPVGKPPVAKAAAK